MRTPLSLSWMEVRCDRSVHRGSFRAGRIGISKESQTCELPAGRAGRNSLDLYGTAGMPATNAGMGIRYRSSNTVDVDEASARKQLASGARGGHRFQPRFLAAPRRPELGSAVP